MPGLAVIQVAGGDRDRQHLFQADGLGAQLRFVARLLFLLAAFVFHRRGQEAFLAGQLDALGRFGELHHVAHTGQSQAIRGHRHRPRDDHPFALFGEEGIIRPVVHNSPSAVSAFSCHWRSTWISAHCRRQKRKCWMPERGSRSSELYSVVIAFR